MQHVPEGEILVVKKIPEAGAVRHNARALVVPPASLPGLGQAPATWPGGGDQAGRTWAWPEGRGE